MKLSHSFGRDVIVSTLSAGLPGVSPVGEDPRLTSEGITLYRRLRDARSVARTSERRRQQSDEPSERVALCPEWGEVSALARDILTTHAKDVEVLVWLTEAETRLSGFAGAAECLTLMAVLVAEHGTALHSLESETAAERFSPIGALSGMGGEGTLIQPVRLLPLVPEASFGEHSLWQLQHSPSSAETKGAIAAAREPDIAARLGEIERCIEAIAALDAHLTALFGADAPPLARLKDVLGEAAAAVRLWSGLHDAPSTSEETSPEESMEGPSAPAATAGPIASRDEAFRQLHEIAAFFRRTEPHSPISDAIETVVRRGQMDFLTLLAELVPDESTRLSVMTKAGIEPPRREN
ncbi:MAG: type VI secretion system protein TssA [Pseudomonadota bacterium]